MNVTVRRWPGSSMPSGRVDTTASSTRSVATTLRKGMLKGLASVIVTGSRLGGTVRSMPVDVVAPEPVAAEPGRAAPVADAGVTVLAEVVGVGDGVPEGVAIIALGALNPSMVANPILDLVAIMIRLFPVDEVAGAGVPVEGVDELCSNNREPAVTFRPSTPNVRGGFLRGSTWRFPKSM